MVANIDMLRACSTATNMSAARCCRVWKLPIGTPNCFRVLRYSTVDFSDSSIAPTASRAHRGAGVVDHALDQRETVLGIADRGIRADLDAGQRDVGGMQAVLGRIALAADALGIRRHQEHADAARVAAGRPWCARSRSACRRSRR